MFDCLSNNSYITCGTKPPFSIFVEGEGDEWQVCYNEILPAMKFCITIVLELYLYFRNWNGITTIEKHLVAICHTFLHMQEYIDMFCVNIKVSNIHLFVAIMNNSPRETLFVYMLIVLNTHTHV